MEPPAAPAQNDPAYDVGAVPRWNLIGNALTPGHDQLAVEVTAPEGTELVDVWVAGGPGERLTADGLHFTATLAIGDGCGSSATGVDGSNLDHCAPEEDGRGGCDMKQS